MTFPLRIAIIPAWLLIILAAAPAFGQCYDSGAAALKDHPQFNHASYRTIARQKCWFADYQIGAQLRQGGSEPSNSRRRIKEAGGPTRPSSASAIPLPPERPILASAFANALTPQNLIDDAFFMIVERGR